MGIAELFAYDATVFTLYQGIVVGVPRARARELDPQFVEQRGDIVIDELAAAIGVKAIDHERKAGEQLLDHGEQVGLADALAGGGELPLADNVHGIDVIEALDTVVIALVHRVDANEPGSAFRCWRAPDADAARPGLGLRVVDTPSLVDGFCAQVVQVRDGN